MPLLHSNSPSYKYNVVSHQVMLYSEMEFNSVTLSAGKPEPLVFHIPQSFFDALSQRLSMGNARMRLPNCTTGTFYYICLQVYF